MKQVRILLWILVALAGAAFLALSWSRTPKPVEQSAPAGIDFGGPFTLVDAKGRPFPSSRLAGKPYAIFFGFTNCPDVCPTTLARLVRLRRELGGGEPFRIVFVTVDPQRDGPAEVGRYAELFDSPVIGLTGSQAQIDAVRKSYGIFAEKVGGGDNYSVDHTATMLLFDKNGRFQSTIAAEEADPAALAKLRRLTSG